MIRTMRDRGTAATEMAFAVTVMLLAIMFAVGASRVVNANGEIKSAARSAARAAAAGRDDIEADALARAAAKRALSDSECGGVTATLDSFAIGGAATVTVTCTIPMGSTSIAGFGSSRSLTASASERVDSLRGD